MPTALPGCPLRRPDPRPCRGPLGRATTTSSAEPPAAGATLTTAPHPAAPDAAIERQRARPALSATRWDRVALGLLVALGFALSYSALQQMATAIHVMPLLTYAYPPLVDGFIAYGVRAVVVLRNAPLHARLYAWLLLGAATSASIWANALHAIDLNQPGTTKLHLGTFAVAILSAIPPLAVAAATHLYIVISRYSNTTAEAPEEVAIVPVTALEARPQVVDETGLSAGTPAGVTACLAQAPAVQIAVASPVTAQTVGAATSAGTPGSADADEYEVGVVEPQQPADGGSSAGQGPSEGSVLRPQPSMGGRPPKAPMEQLVQVLGAAFPDLTGITRERSRKAVTDAGLGASHDRIAEAVELLRQQDQAQQHPAHD